MVEVTLKVALPEELAKRVQESRERLPEILELGLRELTPLESRVFSEVLDFLSHGPSPRQIIEFKSSEAQQTQARELLEKNSAGALSEREDAELDLYERLEHIMIMLKARTRLNQSAPRG